MQRVSDSRINSFLISIKDDKEKALLSSFFMDHVNRYLLSLINISNRDKENSTVSNNVAKDEFFRSTDTVLERARRLELELDKKVLMIKAKQFFRELISDWIYKGKIVERAFRKPRGYPGDYLSLEQIYDNVSNSSNIGYYSDLYFLSDDYAISVRHRKEKIKEILTCFINKYHGNLIKIMNIGCGGCREIREIMVDKTLVHDNEIIFALIDQDSEALEYAKKYIPKQNNINFIFVQENILNLYKDINYIDQFQKQDFIYCLGLCDYIPDRILKQMIEFCLKILDQNGRLVLSHKDIRYCDPVSPDWFCEWKFYPRTEKDFIELVLSVKGYKPSIESVVKEESGRIMFAVIKK